MALHERTVPRKESANDMQASTVTNGVSDSDFLFITLPKQMFPGAGHDGPLVYQAVHDELMLDGNARQNLATFCQTWVEPEIHQLMDECIDKNMIDKDEYPQTAELESRCVNMLADLWNAPSAANTIGCSTTGSSEAAMLGGLAMKWRWRQRLQDQGLSEEEIRVRKPNLVCGPVQVCWHKFARYWDVELREIPMEKDRLIMTPEEAVKRCDENTIGVVPTLGVTFTCQYESVKDVSDALDSLEKETGLDIPIHVDAASGGFLAPFTDTSLVWDFRLPRVKSINASGHKFGLSPLGVGWVVWRDKEDLPRELIFEVNYLGGNMPCFALNFSRPGGQIVAQYYNFVRLGREGYQKIHQACYRTAQDLAYEIGKRDEFKVIYDGREGIPALSWTLNPGGKYGFTLYDLSDRLRSRGWQVAAYSLPEHCEDMVIMRILVRHGFSQDLAELFMNDMDRCLAYFKKNPVSTPLTEDEAGGYSHGR